MVVGGCECVFLCEKRRERTSPAADEEEELDEFPEDAAGDEEADNGEEGEVEYDEEAEGTLPPGDGVGDRVAAGGAATIGGPPGGPTPMGRLR